jgi:prepilin-type N-terminal cleavage/methylation domain-containing protein
MNYMNNLKSEKGVTLVEVLVSITLLSIVLITIMNIFPQMGMMNKHNEDKSQAINAVKELLVEWQNAQDIKDFLVNQSVTPIPRGGLLVGNDYVFTDSIRNYDVTIKIKKTSDLSTFPSKAHVIHIILKNGNVVSETQGYVII